jgi:hypothetical protein
MSGGGGGGEVGGSGEGLILMVWCGCTVFAVRVVF